MHGEIHRKVLSDTELRKGMPKAPTNSTQMEQSTTGKATARGGGQGVGDPLWVPPSLSLLWQWHATMLRQ